MQFLAALERRKLLSYTVKLGNKLINCSLKSNVPLCQLFTISAVSSVPYRVSINSRFGTGSPNNVFFSGN